MCAHTEKDKSSLIEVCIYTIQYTILKEHHRIYMHVIVRGNKFAKSMIEYDKENRRCKHHKSLGYYKVNTEDRVYFSSNQMYLYNFFFYHIYHV